MNLFDSMGEDLTDLMADVADQHNRRASTLMKRLEACHVEACKLSRDLRLEAATADHLFRRRA